jgi:hypothetical protein
MKLLASILLLFVGLFSVCYAEESDFSYSSYSIPGNDLIGNSFVSAYTGDSQLFSYTRGNNYNYVYTADFLNGILPGNITFTRASAGTYFNSSGVMRTAAADQPRFDYDPATLAPRGLLIEPQRTNLVTSIQGWSLNGGSYAPTKTNNAIIAPDGTMTGIQLDYPAISSTNYGNLYTTIVSPPASAAYAYSVWLRGSVGGEVIYLTWTKSTSVHQTFACVLTNQWQRFTLISTLDSAGTNYINIGRDGRAENPSIPAQTIYAWGAQVEAGNFPTSYIPTTSAAATRSADYARITNLSTIGYNQSAGTLFVEAETNYASAGTPVSELTLYGVSGNDRTSFIKGSTGGNAFYMITNSVQQINNSLSFVADNTVYRKAIAFSSDGNLSIASNLSGSVTSFSGKTLPSPINGLYIGNVANSSFYNGWIRQIKYYPYKMPDAGLLQLTQ